MRLRKGLVYEGVNDEKGLNSHKSDRDYIHVVRFKVVAVEDITIEWVLSVGYLYVSVQKGLLFMLP